MSNDQPATAAKPSSPKPRVRPEIKAFRDDFMVRLANFVGDPLRFDAPTGWCLSDMRSVPIEPSKPETLRPERLPQCFALTFTLDGEEPQRLYTAPIPEPLSRNERGNLRIFMREACHSAGFKVPLRRENEFPSEEAAAARRGKPEAWKNLVDRKWPRFAVSARNLLDAQKNPVLDDEEDLVIKALFCLARRCNPDNPLSATHEPVSLTYLNMFRILKRYSQKDRRQSDSEVVEAVLDDAAEDVFLNEERLRNLATAAPGHSGTCKDIDDSATAGSV